jgi:hypothetical protein
MIELLAGSQVFEFVKKTSSSWQHFGQQMTSGLLSHNRLLLLLLFCSLIAMVVTIIMKKVKIIPEIILVFVERIKLEGFFE